MHIHPMAYTRVHYCLQTHYAGAGALQWGDAIEGCDQARLLAARGVNSPTRSTTPAQRGDNVKLAYCAHLRAAFIL